MKYKEELFWILDKEGERGWNAERCQGNIDFVHSLGLKCDCVGWCSLDLGSPRADEILEKIELFCRENGWKARGHYTRTVIDFESDWYEFRLSNYDSRQVTSKTMLTATDGSTIYAPDIKAFLCTNPVPVDCWNEIIVPDRFRKACLRNHLSGVEFCWVRDKGRYEAEQYFWIYVDQRIPRIGTEKDLRYSEEKRQLPYGYYPKTEHYEKICRLGGYVPRLTELVYDLNFHLSDCYRRADLPEGGIAFAYPRQYGTRRILIHKDTVELLIKEKALSAHSLRPVWVVDEFPEGYSVCDTKDFSRPTAECIAMMQKQYEQLKETSRPIRKISEKEALKSMRRAKREQKEYFKKAMSKKQSESLMETEYAPLIPYYLVANGGCLSDEYELLSYEAALEATKEFAASMKKEELLEEKLEGLVFTNCANGDVVLLCTDGRVVRFSHEEPEILEQWPSMAQFVFDAIADDE